METSLTLEEEISQRRETVENSLRCVQGFLDSVDFYIRKLELHTSQDPTTYDIDLNHHLFEFLHAEAMRAVEKAALITKLSSKALLPVTYVDPHSVIMLAVSHLTALSYEKCNVIEEERLINLCNTIRAKATDLRLKPVKRSRAEIEAIFEQMKQRYYEDNQASLKGYSQEFETLNSGMKTLKDDNKENICVKLFIQNEMCITKTLDMMVEEVCTEQDLLKLLAYTVRYEILHDNDHKSTSQPSPDDSLVEELKPIFFGDADEARKFVASIKKATPMQVVNTVNKLITERKISSMSCSKPLWETLTKYGFYDKSRSNWNSYIVKKKQ